MLKKYRNGNPFQTPIIDNAVRDLVFDIETDSACSHQDRDNKLDKLIKLLRKNCGKPDVQERYLTYFLNSQSKMRDFENIGPYPVDSDGFACGFDPLKDENAFWECWSKFGIVVGQSVVEKELCEKTIQRVHTILEEVSEGRCFLEDSETHKSLPVDSQNTPFISRGFFEIYHDDSLAQLRQSLRVYLQHVIIWGRADLWTTFDRIGVKLPGHRESNGLPLHVDQNPTVHPNFQTVQGVLALTDCPLERGTYVGVPGSRHIFPEYAQIVHQRNDGYRGEYVELNQCLDFGKMLSERSQAIPIRAGDLISWDSRTTHANSANLSGEARIVAYISAAPAKEYDYNAIQVRKEAFTTGLGSNVRDALMHASMRPRYTNQTLITKIRRPEVLNYLGKRLYGQEMYGSFN